MLTSVHCTVKACITGSKSYVWAASEALTYLEKFSSWRAHKKCLLKKLEASYCDILGFLEYGTNFFENFSSVLWKAPYTH
jgi:hypothetical protein